MVGILVHHVRLKYLNLHGRRPSSTNSFEMLSRIPRMAISRNLVRRRFISSTPSKRSDALFVVGTISLLHSVTSHWVIPAPRYTVQQPQGSLEWPLPMVLLFYWSISRLLSSSMPKTWSARRKSFPIIHLSTRKRLSFPSSILANGKTKGGRVSASWIISPICWACHPCVYTRLRRFTRCSTGAYLISWNLSSQIQM